MSTGTRLREARKAKGLAQLTVASRAGVSQPYLSQVERGLKRPGGDRLEALAAAVGVGAADLTSRQPARRTPAARPQETAVRSHRDIPATCPCDWEMVLANRRPAGWELRRVRPGCRHHRAEAAR